MSDKLIRYESLAALITALNSQINLSGQQTQAALTATTNAQAATLTIATQTATTVARTADAVQATSNANTATTNAQTATTAATNATNATLAATLATQAATNAANAQAAYAKVQGDYAKAQGANLGDMTKAVYDVNANGTVDNAEQLGGVAPAGYVRSSGGSQDRVMSTTTTAIYPTNLSSTQGFARFRLGVTGETGGNGADVLDLSTGSSAANGAVNALYFDKGQSRVTHKYGGYGASTWSSARPLAYLDEVAPIGDTFLRTGSVAMTGTLQLPLTGLKFPDNAFGGTGDTARIYLATTGGENQELRLEVGNDGPLDHISLRSLDVAGNPNPDGVLVGNWRIWNEGNFTPGLKADLLNPSFTGVVNLPAAVNVPGGSLTSGVTALTLSSTKDLLLSAATGRVGIATSSPAFPLDVAGEVRITGPLNVTGIKTDIPLRLITTGSNAQTLYAGRVQLGGDYNALPDPGLGGLGLSGDLLVLGATRLSSLPVIEGTSARTASGAPRPGTLPAGVPLFTDAGFRRGLNGAAPVNAATLIRSASATTRSGQLLTIRYDTANGPGGFSQTTPARAGGNYLHRIRAKLPVGAAINETHGNIGADGFTRWLTPQAGTGKMEDYAYLIGVGSGTLSDFGSVFVTGTSGSGQEWYAEDAGVYDLSSDGVADLLSAGGSFAGPLSAATFAAVNAGVTGTLQLPAASGSSWFTAGSGDGATFATHNTRMRLWWGMGIEDNTGTVHGLYDARTGTWTVNGGYVIGSTSLTQSDGGSFRVTTPTGTLDIGSKNTTATHYYTDRGAHVFNRPGVFGGNLQVFGSETFSGTNTTISPTGITINGQAAVTTNDTRLKGWGVFTPNGQDFLGRGGRVFVAADNGSGGPGTLHLNHSGDFPGGTHVFGGLGIDNTLSVGGASTLGALTLQNGQGLKLQAAAGAGTPPGDVVFQTNIGTELARIYANASQLRLRLNGDESSGLNITATNNVIYKPLFGLSDVGALDTNAHSHSSFVAQTTNANTPPAIGFLNPGVFGQALYMTDAGQMRLHGSDNGDYQLLSSKEVDLTQVSGIRSTLINGQDANTVRPAGLYHGTSVLNAPTSNTYYYFWQQAHEDPNYAAQIASHYFSDTLSFRRKDGNVWQPWRQVWHTGNFNPANYLPLTGGNLGGPLNVGGAVTASDFLKTSTRASKQDIGTYADDALKVIGDLDIVTYRYRENPEREHVGIIADDTHNGHVAPDHSAFDTASTLAIALRAIQVLMARIDHLEALAEVG